MAALSVSRVRDYFEMIRFSHTVFALPFALLGVVLACVIPAKEVQLNSAMIVTRSLAVIFCMVTARSAAMAFNRLVDASIDARNPRTATRHLPSGRLSRGGVWLFFGLMVVGFLIGCALFWPNWLPLAGSIPVLSWICAYSFAKRFTSAAHLWLGVALALSPVCAWLAVRGEEVIVDPSDLGPAVGLAAAIAFWVMGFDIIYACQDAEFDRQHGLHSIPGRLGVPAALRMAAAVHFVMLAILLALPWLFPQLRLGAIYVATFFVVSVLVVTQHRLVRPDDLGRVNLAFFHINAVISFALSTTTALDALLG